MIVLQSCSVMTLGPTTCLWLHDCSKHVFYNTITGSISYYVLASCSHMAILIDLYIAYRYTSIHTLIQPCCLGYIHMCTNIQHVLYMCGMW